MQRLIDFVQIELEIFCAVTNRRIRSLVLFLAAIAIPAIFQIAVLSFVEKLPLAASWEGVRTIVMLMGLALMLKLSILAAQTYLKDRAAFLRF